MSERKRTKTTFKNVPVNSELYLYWNSGNPLDCDTFRAFKTSENSVTAGSEFSQLTIHPDEPCVLYLDAN